MTDVTVIVLAFGAEPLLQECVSSVLRSVSADGALLDLEVVVIDNGAPSAVSALAADARLRTVTMAGNTGFTGGCNAGAREARGRFLVFLNSDAVVDPHAVSSLLRELEDPSVGLVCGSVRLMGEPSLMNSAGNPMHYLGIVWAGGFGEPVARHADSGDVTAVTGALFATRRSTWESLGGFDPLFFAYHEDVELSLRCWQTGLRVRFCADAVALHDYHFSRNESKRYLLERNRWLVISTTYPTPVLLAVLPALLGFEIAMLVLATTQGWLPAKLRGYGWLLRHADGIRRRRRRVQADCTQSALAFSELLAPRLEPAVLGPIPGLELLNAVLVGYWWLATTLLRISSRA